MAQTLPQARESVAYYQTLPFASADLQGAIDITGYTFKLELARDSVATPLITLGMAATALGEGFAIASGPALLTTIRILKATLGGLPDTTGDFQLFGDLLAQPPGGEFFFVADLIIPVTKGPTAP